MSFSRRALVFCFFILFFILSTPAVFALNGGHFIGVGVPKGMGGAGIAAPSQDAAGGIHLNPAGIYSFIGPHFDFGGAMIFPSVRAQANFGAGPTESKSQDRLLITPEIGFATPLFDRLSFGLSFSTVAGADLDYRNRDVGQVSALGGALPLGFADEKVHHMIFELAPTVAFQLIRDHLTIGASPLVNYGLLDLGSGMHSTVGIAGRVGARYKINDQFAVGATYQTPSRMKYNRLIDLDRDGSFDQVRLNQPQSIGVGVAWTPFEKLLVAADGKWINWGGAGGFEDLDWKNQWVISTGAQMGLTENLTVRAGYNYGTNPLRNHSGFHGEDPYVFQGKSLAGGAGGRLNYETLRVIGLPGISKHHVTAGVSYKLHRNIQLTGSYEHAFKHTVSETGTLNAVPISVGSSLSANVVTLGLNFDFE